MKQKILSLTFLLQLALNLNSQLEHQVVHNIKDSTCYIVGGNDLHCFSQVKSVNSIDFEVYCSGLKYFFDKSKLEFSVIHCDADKVLIQRISKKTEHCFSKAPFTNYNEKFNVLEKGPTEDVRLQMSELERAIQGTEYNDANREYFREKLKDLKNRPSQEYYVEKQVSHSHTFICGQKLLYFDDGCVFKIHQDTIGVFHIVNDSAIIVAKVGTPDEIIDFDLSFHDGSLRLFTLTKGFLSQYQLTKDGNLVIPSKLKSETHNWLYPRFSFLNENNSILFFNGKELCERSILDENQTCFYCNSDENIDFLSKIGCVFFLILTLFLLAIPCYLAIFFVRTTTTIRFSKLNKTLRIEELHRIFEKIVPEKRENAFLGGMIATVKGTAVFLLIKVWDWGKVCDCVSNLFMVV